MALLTNDDIRDLPGVNWILRADRIVPVHELPAARLECWEDEIAAGNEARSE